MDERIQKYEEKMKKTLASLESELVTIRAGRANPHILDKLAVDYYGAPTPIAKRKTKTVYRDENKTIKLFVENYSKAAILNEALIQARVEENTDLKISKLLEVTKIENRWALVTEYIEGTPLDVLMEQNPEQEDEY